MPWGLTDYAKSMASPLGGIPGGAVYGISNGRKTGSPGELYDYAKRGGPFREGGVFDPDRLGAAKELADQEYDPNRNPGALEGQADRKSALQYYGDTAGLRGAPQAGRSAFRADQRGQINRLTDLAEGRGPSLAALQARDSLQRGVSAQQALAAGARPGQQAGAARMASQQGSLLAGSVAGASAQARAQEQLGAMNQLTGAIYGARGQDQSRNLANVQSQLQQTGLNDQQRRAMYELELKNAIAGQQGALGQAGLRNNLLVAGLGQPSNMEKAANVGSGLLQAYLMGG